MKISIKIDFDNISDPEYYKRSMKNLVKAQDLVMDYFKTQKKK